MSARRHWATDPVILTCNMMVQSRIEVLPGCHEASFLPVFTFSARVAAKTHTRDRIGKQVHWLRLFLTVAVTAGLWCTFVGTAKLQEMLLGAVCVGVTVVFLVEVSRTSGIDLEFHLKDVVQAWRIPWYVVSDLWQLSLVLVKDVLRMAPAEDLYRVCGFDSSKRDPVRLARDVLSILFTTTSPNLIVVGIDISQSRMLFHQLSRSPVPRMTKALGAKG